MIQTGTVTNLLTSYYLIKIIKKISIAGAGHKAQKFFYYLFKLSAISLYANNPFFIVFGEMLNTMFGGM
jgi:hypothetical protein